MAKEFGFKPGEVDKMDLERIESLLLIGSKIKEKQERDQKLKEQLRR